MLFNIIQNRAFSHHDTSTPLEIQKDMLGAISSWRNRAKKNIVCNSIPRKSAFLRNVASAFTIHGLIIYPQSGGQNYLLAMDMAKVGGALSVVKVFTRSWTSQVHFLLLESSANFVGYSFLLVSSTWLFVDLLLKKIRSVCYVVHRFNYNPQHTDTHTH